MKICKEDDCERPVHSRGQCQLHYMRWWKASSGKWKPHRKAASEKLGRELSQHEIVMFVDGNHDNLRHENLVVMPRGQHMRFLKQKEAKAITGHADANPCIYCKKWEPLLTGNKRYHNECLRARYAKKSYRGI